MHRKIIIQMNALMKWLETTVTLLLTILRLENLVETGFEDFCLSLSWKYRFSQNVNHAKVQSKTNKY